MVGLGIRRRVVPCNQKIIKGSCFCRVVQLGKDGCVFLPPLQQVLLDGDRDFLLQGRKFLIFLPAKLPHRLLSRKAPTKELRPPLRIVLRLLRGAAPTWGTHDRRKGVDGNIDMTGLEIEQDLDPFIEHSLTEFVGSARGKAPINEGIGGNNSSLCKGAFFLEPFS